MQESLVQKWAFRAGWGAIVVLAVFLFGITAIYFSFRSDINFLLKKQDVVFNVAWRTAFYIHITGGMLCLITGPFQFVKRIRNGNRKLHRTIGKIYLASILFLAGPSGLFMAFYSEGGFIASIGFTLMALLWMLSTWKAYETIREGDYIAHRNWMTRSFALTLAAVTLRLYVPIMSYYLSVDHNFIDTSAAWVSWIPNLIVAELIIRFFPKRL